MTLTEKFEEILYNTAFDTDRLLDVYKLSEQIIQAVKERDQEVLGKDIDGNDSYKTTDYIFGHMDRAKEIKTRMEETL